MNLVEAQEILKKSQAHPNKGISEAVKKESTLEVLTELLSETQLDTKEGWTNIKECLESKLSGKKYERAMLYCRYPLPVVDFTESLLRTQEKVFDGKNASFSIVPVRKNERFSNAIKNLNINSWIKDNGKAVLKNKPNSIVVIDKDPKGYYLIRIDANRMIDISYDKNNDIEWICFKHSEDRIAIYDSKTYWVFVKNKETEEYELESQNKHSFGYCPARHFVDERANTVNDYERVIPLSSSVSTLIDWTEVDISKRYVDDYTSFPIIEKVKERCGVANCENGVVKTSMTIEEYGNPRTVIKSTPCNVCKDRQLIGAGTTISLKQTKTKDEQDGAGKFRFITPPIENNEYLIEKLQKIEDTTKARVLGVASAIDITSVNEMQLKGGMEEMQDKFLRLKSSLERVHRWIVLSIAKVYNVTEINLTINYGTEFYLMTTNELLKRYELSKDIGLPSIELESTYNQIIHTKYRGQETEILRQRVVNLIDPFPFSTIKEVTEIYEMGVVEKELYYIKANFVRFVQEIELENGDLFVFGESIDEKTKIENLKQELRKKAKKELTNIKDVQQKPSTEE